jgi:hypothetical protein
MIEFNRMTVVSGAEVISDSYSHIEIEVLEVQCGIETRGQGVPLRPCIRGETHQ